MKNKNLFYLFAIPLLTTSCQSTIQKAVRETKYSAYEMVGVQKRDLFKKEVKNVKEDQEETSESFKDALDRLKEIYAFDGGNMEREYRSLNSAYSDSEKRVQDVKSSVVRLETVAQDLFEEWKKEIAQIGSAELRARSTKALTSTETKYRDLHAALKKSESRMDPVLAQLRDQTLFLKHNLNAQAIAGLKAESAKIQNDIDALVKDMNKSIQQAEEVAKDF